MIIEYYDGQRFSLGFDPEKHGYFLLEKDKKIPIQSVTRVIDACYPKNLHEWSVREGANKFKEEMIERSFIRNDEQPVINEIYERIIGAYKEVSSHAADIGDTVHGLISTRLEKGWALDKDEPEGEEVKACMHAFGDWVKLRKPRFLESEKLVYYHSDNPTYRFAGTLDSVVEFNNQVFVLDFKTSKKIYKHYHLQVAAYAAAYQKTRSIITNGRIHYPPVYGMILRLDKKTGKFQEKIFKLDNHFNIFKNCLEIKAWNSKRIAGVKYVD